MALVDPEYQFIWTSVEAQGKTHDSTVHWSLEKNRWRRDDSQCISTGGRRWNTVPYFVYGAFPLTTWFMKPHGDAILPDDKLLLQT